MKHTFPTLFSPISIGTMTLRNRLIMPAMAEGLATETGEVTEAMTAYYGARAKGGASMVITDVVVDASGLTLAHQPRIDDDRFLPGLQQLAHAIKQHGAKAALQLHHAGPKAKLSIAGTEAVSSSPIPNANGVSPRELTRDNILTIVDRFVSAAVRAKQAGFDGLEIMAARGYLLSAFVSAAYNKRGDEFGGCVENRARFLLLIIKAIKEKLGEDYPVWCRIDGEEWHMESGITQLESQEIARLAEQAGADAIHVFGGDKIPAHATLLRTNGKLLFPSEHPFGYLLGMAESVKQAVSIPVIAVGRLTPQLAEDSIKHGRVDVVAMGRGLIADPNLPNKAKAGTLEDIIPCIACLKCRDYIYQDTGKGIRCTVNPATGLEQSIATTTSSTAKKVLVVGGGPAGMQAALTAVKRGHQVTLVERSRRLGGSMLVAGIVNPAIRPFTKQIVKQVLKQPIQIDLNTEISLDYVDAMKPDAVVLAYGGAPRSLDISGVDCPNVLSGYSLLMALTMNRLPTHVGWGQKILWHLASPLMKYAYHPALINWGLRFGFPIKKRVVIIGGGFAGLEMADVLAEKGKQVTVLEQGPELGDGFGISYLWMYLERLKNYGVVTQTESRVQEITSKGVKVVVAGEHKFYPADTVLLTLPVQPQDNSMSRELEKKGYLVHTIGDAANPGKITEATAAGFQIGMAL